MRYLIKKHTFCLELNNLRLFVFTIAFRRVQSTKIQAWDQNPIGTVLIAFLQDLKNNQNKKGTN